MEKRHTSKLSAGSPRSLGPEGDVDNMSLFLKNRYFGSWSG